MRNFLHQQYPSTVMFNGLNLHSSKNRIMWISPLLLQPPVQDGGSILENIYCVWFGYLLVVVRKISFMTPNSFNVISSWNTSSSVDPFFKYNFSLIMIYIYISAHKCSIDTCCMEYNWIWDQVLLKNSTQPPLSRLHFSPKPTPSPPPFPPCLIVKGYSSSRDPVSLDISWDIEPAIKK